MIYVASGLPGAGKSTRVARIGIDIMYHNRYLSEKYPELPRRRLYSNLKFSPIVEREFAGEFEYWHDLRQLVKLRNVDIIIDEVPVYFDARQWENMSLEVRKWLAQHRKHGINIYCTAQDFAQCDKAFRRLVSHLEHFVKVMGSRDISATLPPPRWVWAVCMVQTLDPTKYDEEKSKFQNTGVPNFVFIDKASTQIFDTTAEVKTGGYPPLSHTERICEDDNCSYHKVIHV